MVQRQHRQYAVADPELEDPYQLRNHERQVAVREHHTLGPARRARGVAKQHRVIEIFAGERDGRRRGSQQRIVRDPATAFAAQ